MFTYLLSIIVYIIQDAKWKFIVHVEDKKGPKKRYIIFIDDICQCMLENWIHILPLHINKARFLIMLLR